MSVWVQQDPKTAGMMVVLFAVLKWDSTLLWAQHVPRGEEG